MKNNFILTVTEGFNILPSLQIKIKKVVGNLAKKLKTGLGCSIDEGSRWVTKK